MNLSLLPYRPERDAYRLLGITPSASTDEVAAACRRLARAFHPDTNGSPRATQEMQVVNVVRGVLTDPSRRREYDVARDRWHAAAQATPIPRYAPMPMPAPTATGRGSARRSQVSTAERVARAAWSGMRVTLAELAPRRCVRCRIVTDGEDAYCAACGTPLLTGG
jgi:curved DNA-binding protein CbpA